MNIKKGLRRIVITFVCAFFLLNVVEDIRTAIVSASFIDLDFANASKVYVKENPTKTVDLASFVRIYLLPQKEIITLDCHPYRQYCGCIGSDLTIKQGQVFEYNKTIIVKMPTRLEFLKKQFKDFITLLSQLGKDFLVAATIWVLFLLSEKLFSWIIKGFKD